MLRMFVEKQNFSEINSNLPLVSIYTNVWNRSIYRFYFTRTHLFLCYHQIQVQCFYIYRYRYTIYIYVCPAPYVSLLVAHCGLLDTILSLSLDLNSVSLSPSSRVLSFTTTIARDAWTFDAAVLCVQEVLTQVSYYKKCARTSWTYSSIVHISWLLLPVQEVLTHLIK